MKLTNKKVKILSILTALVLTFYAYHKLTQPEVWGDSNDEPYITIKGKKPVDATVRAWTLWGADGENCQAKTFSFSNVEWSQGANVKWDIDHDFSQASNEYELRIPYQSFHDSLNCNVTLGDIKVQAYNSFDTVGFAQLRIYQAGNRYNNKALSLNSKIEAKDCRARYYEDLKEWSSGLACSFYTNEKIQNKKSDLVVFNAYTAYFDFSQFNDDTVIHYDILAGGPSIREAVPLGIPHVKTPPLHKH